ncbi:hypothetical protein JCM16303_007279 [Sporobolomyces ruberrimus]
MLNDRLTDELLALESIYPDAVRWTERSDGHVDLEITLKVEFERPQSIHVHDHVQKVPHNVETATLGTRSDTPVDTSRTNPVQPSAESKKTPSRRSKGEGRQRKAELGQQTGNSLAPNAQPFRPRTGQGRERTAPSQGSTSTTTARAAGTVVSSNTIPLSHSSTPRISIAPRPPPSPPLVEEIVAPLAKSDTVASNSLPKLLPLRHLPPLHITINLPPEYPESSGPSRIDLESEGSWVEESKRREALSKLEEVYAGDECLFGIAELLSSASPDFLSTLSLSDPIVLHQQPPPDLASPPVSSSASPATSAVPRLSEYLLAYDRTASSAAFSTSSHQCPLCFSPRKGSNCIQLSSCSSTFCTPCLRDYFSLLITEGMVRSVACPAIECVEKRSKWEKATGATLDENSEMERPGRVTADEVEQLCGVEMRKRYEWLKEKIRVESDPSISFCPRESCQAPTPKLGDDDKLRLCTSCNFAYCVFCRKGWHGTRNACELPQSSAIVTRYLAADEAEKRILEQRYGSANLKRLVTAFEEERALQEWLEEHATRCPGCSVPIEKSSGCNHMTCGKCGAHLCYRCGKSVSPTDPYKHFNTPSGSCYGKLFDFSPGFEPPVEEWLGELMVQDLENAH